MSRCQHRGWLDVLVDGPGTEVASAHHCTFRASDRLDRLVEDLPRAVDQRPSIVQLIGGTRKDKALQALLHQRPIVRPSAPEADVELILDHHTRFSDRPVVFVDIHDREHGASSRSQAGTSCHQSWEYHVSELSGAARGHGTIPLIDVLSARLVGPATDVVCLFVSDFSTAEAAARRLSTWLERRATPCHPMSPPPTLILVEGTNTRDSPKPTTVCESLSQCDLKLSDVFSTMVTLEIPRLGPGGRACQYRPLRQAILGGSQRLGRTRRENGTLFSAPHLAALFRRQVNHFRNDPWGTLDLVRAVRMHDPISDRLSQVMVEFLKDFRSPGSLSSLAIPLLAMCLLQDHYRPKTHRKFPPIPHR